MPIGAAGTGKQFDCQTYRARTGFEQQECDAVNFMSRNPGSRPKFTIDQKSDQVRNGSGSVIGQPGLPPGCCENSSPPDRDFGQAAAMMEAAREAGVYGIDPDKVEIFKGYMEQCSVKVLGGSTLRSCCQAAGGGTAFTNHAILGAGLKVAGEAGRESLALGSHYMYDALYSELDSAIVDKGLSAMNSWASGLGDGVFNPQFGVYGFTFDFTLANGFEMVGFDPYSFALSVSIMLIQEWLSCEPAEQVTAMKRGQNLCVHVGTYCSREVLGVCLEKKERHCCFNSRLARIINRQGRAQLGLTTNSCGGFNQAQLQALDFSRMDLSEFIADITPRDVPASTLSQRVRQTVDERVKGYYEE
jgi:conjugal transfer mating pair stabilization protein TraN